MSEVKHTPAHTGRQWSAKSYGYEKYAILDDRGTEIGFVHRRRDAHLVAAAPDLLTTIKKLTAEMVGIGGFGPEIRELVGDTNWSVLTQRVQEAHAAIAKAEGREINAN